MVDERKDPSSSLPPPLRQVSEVALRFLLAALWNDDGPPSRMRMRPTPNKPEPRSWWGSVQGRRCTAEGGPGVALRPPVPPTEQITR